MKPSLKKKLIGTGMMVLAVVAVVEFQKVMQKQCGTCLDKHSPGLYCPDPTFFNPPARSNAVSARPQLLDFGAGKCINCKLMNKVLEELRSEYSDQLDIRFIDVWENESAGKAYSIHMIPTQIFMDAEGNELFRHEGFISKEDILKKWNELGVQL
jgi:thioredoxin 1